MTRLVRAFRVLDGKTIDVLRLAADVAGEQAKRADDFYRRLGVTRETWHLQDTPGGAMVIVCTDVEDLPRAGQLYAASRHEFDTWFKQQVQRLSGIDPNRQPEGPPSRQIFEWSVEGGPSLPAGAVSTDAAG